MPWSELLRPTIQLMEEGYPTSHALAGALKSKEWWIRQEPTMQIFINKATNRTFAAGEQIRTRFAGFADSKINLTETISSRRCGSSPIRPTQRGSTTTAPLHRGPWRNSRETVDIRNPKTFLGGLLTLEDFSSYTSVVRDDEVVYTNLTNGRHICGPPPPSGSAVAQAILNVLDG